MATPTVPTWLKDMQAWIASGSKLQMWDKAAHNPGQDAGPGEGGVDLTAPVGTPVYALATGPLESAQTFASQGFAHPGSVLSQMVNVPGYGPQEIYYQHIDLLPSIEKCIGGDCGGTIIQKGQQIGTVGTAGETEVGFNAAGAWGNLYGIKTPGKTWYDKPEPLIANLMSGGGLALNDPTATLGYDTTSSGTNNCPFWCAFFPPSILPVGPCSNCDPNSPGGNATGQQLATIVSNVQNKDWWARVGVVILGAIIVLIGAWKLLK
jgi:hypothetical protein